MEAWIFSLRVQPRLAAARWFEAFARAAIAVAAPRVLEKKVEALVQYVSE
jgi:hypothetical protein